MVGRDFASLNKRITNMGTFTFDPYQGYSEADLKRRCRELCSALDRWQTIALVLTEGGIGALPDDMRDDLLRLREAYGDDAQAR